MKKAKALKVIKCQGIDYEIGQQYAEACREDFSRIIEEVYALSQQYKINKEQIIANINEFLPLVENFDPQTVDFIKGMPKSSNIGFEEALMLRATLELMFIYAGKIPGLCTSFAATGKAVKSGKNLLDQNFEAFDNIPFVLLRIKRADGIDQLCLAYGGIFECGLNSLGIGIGMNATLPYHNVSYEINIPLGCYLPS